MQQVIAVSLCATHAFSKQVRPAIRLLKASASRATPTTASP